MKSYREYLTESFKNLIGNIDIKLKEKYADEVWNILQESYKQIGGIKGSGFNSKEDMINSIPFWKLFIYNNKVVSVILYKDKDGRKSVASGTDGSEIGKKKIIEIFKSDLFRSYAEKSKGSLGLLMKTIPFDLLVNFLIKPNSVQKVLKNDNIIPILSVEREEWPEDAKLMLDKYPQLKPYGYLREIGKHLVFKVMVGTVNKKIV